ncbi:DNA-directed RNA polymerase III subunit 1-like [Vigna unguiculata]|uniref:DNA-directed RNA polymerase III subunit 1-like n=1 Tax=Vigna unguiculata TaxID=3917 RepID=UPI001015D364|nr:DNA-directed RNA polymerase III subunit 1-like [Vigna unguiculata]
MKASMSDFFKNLDDFTTPREMLNDFYMSSFVMTRKDNFYDRSALFSCLCLLDDADLVDLPTPAIVKPVELWSGKQLFNILLRPHANVKVCVDLTVEEKIYTKVDEEKRELKTLCPNDGFVYFRNSELISGQFGKVTLGNGNTEGLLSLILRECEAEAAASCLNRLAKVRCRQPWILDFNGATGMNDITPNEMVIKKKEEILSEAYRKCDEYIEAFNKGKLELIPGCDAAQTLETRITQVLNGLSDVIRKVFLQTTHWRNILLVMSQCGWKNSTGEMIGCLGLQSVDGFEDRILPHFPKNAQTPAARGFVANSFFSGLTCTEFFLHCQANRVGLLDD